MTLSQNQARYSGLSIALHWLMLVLLAAVYA
ncbi:cytochrome b, partial [Pseudomonas frederiksbergensis]|nr:cytochrome b [Pseudomonas frederiksbergensis]